MSFLGLNLSIQSQLVCALFGSEKAWTGCAIGTEFARTCWTRKQSSPSNQYNIDRRCVPLNNSFILIFVFLLSLSHSFQRYLLRWKVWLLSRLPFRPPHSSLQDPKPGIFRPNSIFIKETPFQHFQFGPRWVFFWQIFYLFATFWGVSSWISLSLVLFLFWEFGLTENGNRW